MAERYNNNDLLPLMDSQLEASLDAMLFDSNYDGPVDEMNSGMHSANSTTNTAPSLAPLHVGESMALPNPFALVTKETSIEQNTTARTEGNVKNPLIGEIGGSSNRGSISATPVAMSAPRDKKPPPATFSRKPQLFGKNVPFSVSIPPPDTVKSVPKPSCVGKRKREPVPSTCAVSEDESERERRRQDRNHREQQRSQQISNQIAVLRSLLADASVECKPDKFSTLASVVDYVKSLQQKSSMLDSEHKKLLDTIQQTTEIMSSQYMAVQSNPDGSSNNVPEESDAAVIGDSSSESDQVFVQGIDYKAIFRASPFALATTSIDGRFLDCSEGFEKITKFSREELLPLEKTGKSEAPTDDSSSMTSDISSGNYSSACEDPCSAVKNLSLFNVLYQGDMGAVYHGMYDVLQQPQNHLEENSDESEEENELAADRWSNDVRLSRDNQARVKLYLNLVRTLQQRPRFFNCTLVSGESAKLKASPTAA